MYTNKVQRLYINIIRYFKTYPKLYNLVIFKINSIITLVIYIISGEKLSWIIIIVSNLSVLSFIEAGLEI